MIGLYLLIIMNLLIAFYILGDGFKKEIKEFIRRKYGKNSYGISKRDR